MVGIKLRVAAARTWPIQIQSIETVDLLRLGTPMHLHGRLLVTVVPGDVECAGGDTRHLRHRRPWVAATGDVLQQRLVKRSRGLHVLQVNDRLAFDLHDVGHFPHLQIRVHRRREPRRENDARFAEAFESLRRNRNFISAWRQQVEEVRAVRPCVAGALRHQRRAFHRHRGTRHCRSRSIGDHSRDFPSRRHLPERQTRQEPRHESAENENR